nr:Fic family protein [Actinomyces ruminis]
MSHRCPLCAKWLFRFVGVVAGVLRGEGPGEPAGSPRRACLPAAPLSGSGFICNATSGLTTPVNGLLKGPKVYSRTLSSVVNAQPAQQTPQPDSTTTPTNRRNPIDPVVVAGIAHYQFETLHPFRDGCWTDAGAGGTEAGRSCLLPALGSCH